MSRLKIVPHFGSATRRSFLCATVRTGAAAWAGLRFLPRAALGATDRAAPNERITMGMIGMGRQAYHANLLPFLASPDTQVVAVCDVDAWRLEEGRKRVEEYYAAQTRRGSYKGCMIARAFRNILARSDIDAVMIDTAHGEYTGFAYGKLISWWDRRVVLFPFQEGG